MAGLGFRKCLCRLWYLDKLKRAFCVLSLPAVLRTLPEGARCGASGKRSACSRGRPFACWQPKGDKRILLPIICFAFRALPAFFLRAFFGAVSLFLFVYLVILTYSLSPKNLPSTAAHDTKNSQLTTFCRERKSHPAQSRCIRTRLTRVQILKIFGRRAAAPIPTAGREAGSRSGSSVAQPSQTRPCRHIS